MYCPNCGSSLKENESLCPFCRMPINASTQNITNMQNSIQNTLQSQNESYETTSSSKKKKPWGILFLILIIVVVVLLIYFLFIKPTKKEEGPIKTPDVHVDSNLENTDKNNNASAFLLAVSNVYSITNSQTYQQETVITGRVERGEVHVGDTVQLIGLDQKSILTTVEKMEMFHNTLDSAKEGDNIGIYLKGVTKENVKIGQVLVEPNSMAVSKKLEAEVSFLTEEEIGPRQPFTKSAGSKIYFRTVDIDWNFTFPKGVTEAKQGDTVILTIHLASSIGMEVGSEFSIREGGRVSAKGRVTKVYEE